MACVLISNQALDAAKANRGLVCFRSEPDREDLGKLATACAGSQSPTTGTFFAKATTSYLDMKRNGADRFFADQRDKDEKLNTVFQLRDFYHFVRYFPRCCRGNEPRKILFLFFCVCECVSTLSNLEYF